MENNITGAGSLAESGGHEVSMAKTLLESLSRPYSKTKELLPQIADMNQAKQALDAINPSSVSSLSKREKALGEYCLYVDNLVAFGVFNENQGQALKIKLMNELTDTAQEQTESGFSQFLAQQPQFFENRENLRKYLEIVGVELDNDDFTKIAQLVEELENAAVERFSQKTSHGETLKEFNELAKERLKTLSSSVTGGKLEAVKLFTPEEIGKMSSAEFKKNEQIINMQLQKKLF